MFSYATRPTTERNVSFDFQRNENTTSFLNKLSLGQYTQTFIDEGFESIPAVCFFHLFWSRVQKKSYPPSQSFESTINFLFFPLNFLFF